MSQGSLGGLTLEAVARRARCAKGLVNYHFGTKDRLLEHAARQVLTQRVADRLAALRHPGAEALDRLWDVLAGEVRSSAFRLWLGLVSDAVLAPAAGLRSEDRDALASAAGTALAVPVSNPVLGSVAGVLDGFQLLLLQGVGDADVREWYDRWWLGVIKEG